jgi:valyl-tRNA synthetase
VCDDVQNHLNDFRFDLAAQRLYHFVWGTYCDYFLEFIKPILTGDDQSARKEILDVAYWVYGQILTLLHPFVPFMTEHLWTGIGGEDMLCKRSYPLLSDLKTDQKAEDQIEHLMQLIMAIRKTRADFRVPPAAFLHVSVTGNHMDDAMMQTLLKRMARLDNLTLVTAYTTVPGDISLSINGVLYYVHLGDAVDLEQEKKRLGDEIAKLEKDMASSNARLSNQDFMAKAKEDVIEEMRERVELAIIEIAQKKEALEAL